MTIDEFCYGEEKIVVPTFIVPVKYYGIVNELSDNEAGALFKTLFEVAMNPDDPTEDYFYGWQKVIFDMMKSDIITDCKKYRRMVIKNRQNASLGGRAKKGYKKT